MTNEEDWSEEDKDALMDLRLDMIIHNINAANQRRRNNDNEARQSSDGPNKPPDAS